MKKVAIAGLMGLSISVSAVASESGFYLGGAGGPGGLVSLFSQVNGGHQSGRRVLHLDNKNINSAGKAFAGWEMKLPDNKSSIGMELDAMGLGLLNQNYLSKPAWGGALSAKYSLEPVDQVKVFLKAGASAISLDNGSGGRQWAIAPAVGVGASYDVSEHLSVRLEGQALEGDRRVARDSTGGLNAVGLVTAGFQYSF
ncbi:outer membrane beta-barrel protein [Burkholderia sp. WSM2232]|uniref:outer membrane beta-barrel protein n=1 Tax=Burkholderia sp. WSM2232 TaxID=944436 RepID=UPI00047FF885|nr:outer membrane beta-barrel protein [Burkholderia sp. WSM2232]